MDRRKLKLPKESQIVPQIIEYLLIKGHYVWRNNTGALKGAYPNQPMRPLFFGKLGSSDILGVSRDGLFLAVEVKRPGKLPTTHQTAFLNEINQRGGVAFVANGVADVMARGL